MTDKELLALLRRILAVFRRIGLAIGFALLAGGLAYGFRGSDEAAISAAIGGALVGFFITPFQKKEVKKD